MDEQEELLKELGKSADIFIFFVVFIYFLIFACAYYFFRYSLILTIGKIFIIPLFLILVVVKLDSIERIINEEDEEAKKIKESTINIIFYKKLYSGSHDS